MSKIYVGNLPSGIAERDLEDEFIRFGTLRSVWIARKPPGFAFIEYDDPRDAEDACRKLDGFKGWRVEISRATGPRPKPIGGGGGYGGYGSGGGYGGGGYGGAPSGRRSPSPVRRRRSPSYEPRRRSPSPVRRRRSPSYEPRRSLSPIRRDRSLSPRRDVSP